MTLQSFHFIIFISKDLDVFLQNENASFKTSASGKKINLIWGFYSAVCRACTFSGKVCFFIVIAAEPRRLNSWPAESVDADTDWGCVCMAVMAKYKHRYQKPFQTASQGTDLRQTNTQIGSQCPSHGDKCLVWYTKEDKTEGVIEVQTTVEGVLLSVKVEEGSLNIFNYHILMCSKISCICLKATICPVLELVFTAVVRKKVFSWPKCEITCM